jgi:hypothetical protein
MTANTARPTTALASSDAGRPVDLCGAAVMTARTAHPTEALPSGEAGLPVALAERLS